MTKKKGLDWNLSSISNRLCDLGHNSNLFHFLIYKNGNNNAYTVICYLQLWILLSLNFKTHSFKINYILLFFPVTSLCFSHVPLSYFLIQKLVRVHQGTNAHIL